MHPIVELMYPDFALEAADQLLNHVGQGALHVRRRARGAAHRAHPGQPRARLRAAAQRATRPGLFALFPGWRIAAPSTAADYIGLFNAAMLHPRPGLVIDDNRLMKTTSPMPAAGIDLVIPPGVVAAGARRART